MPTFELTSPEGKTYRVTGPEGSTEQQALQQLQAKLAPPAKPQGPMSWGDVAKGAVTNLGPSAVAFGHSMAQPFLHPLDTAESVLGIGSGLIQKGAQKLGLKSETDDIAAADAAGGFLKDRYGGMENIKRTLATDPVGAAADVAGVLQGGGGLAARLPGAAGKIGGAVQTAGRLVDPLSIPIKGAKMAGQGAAEVIGGLGTHTGADSLRIAAKAGQQGGAAGTAFLENMRGTAPMEETVQAARQAVDNIRRERGAAYRTSKAAVDADTTVLNFNKIDQALANISQVKTFKGQVIDPKTQAIRQEIAQAIQEWKMLPPDQFHTVEGLDALKQKIGNLYDEAKHVTPEKVVVDKAYKAIKDTITDQAPAYAKVMKAYEEASAQIKDIEKTLSLNPNASVDTALRKLQSTLRDNVNTSFGRRKELAQYLIEAGAPHLMERLAGQAMKPWTPRGLAKMVGTEVLAATAGAFGAGATGAGGAALGALPFMSPRIMGEAAYYGGKASNIPGRAAGHAAFQSGRMGEKLDPREMVVQDAKAALRDKRGYTKSQIEAIRSVAGGDAPIETLMTVKRLLESKSYEGVQ